MRRLALAAVAVLIVALAGTWTATAAQTPTTAQSIHAPKPPGPQCFGRDFAKFSAKVWAKDRWERGSPSKAAVKAARRRFACSPVRANLEAIWAGEKLRYGRYRAFREIAPYPGGGTYWAVPYPIVRCESGGSWSAYNPSGAEGPYQLLGHGQPWPVTSWHDKMEHHRIAGALYAEYGTAPWLSSESCWG